MRKVICLLIFVLIVGVANADVYTLYPDGTGDFATIQDAITGSVSRDTILLADGIYSGTGNRDIDFQGKDLTLRSVSGNAEACIIDIMGIPGNGFTEQGLIFQNGETSAMQVMDITIQNADGDGP
jgi:hypothetical protein